LTIPVHIVFSDTNALVAMLCFPIPKSGRLPLAHEVAEAVAAGECDLLVSEVVAEELREVVRRSFPDSQAEIETFLETFGVTSLPMPDATLLAEAKKVCVDPDDAPILVAAVTSARTHGAGYLLSNDIETFHTPEMKRYLEAQGMAVVTLYGLLKLLGRR
jgi:predicted nucleic acid-binding protein